MAKKTEDLKVTDEQLKKLQEIVGAMNGATTRVGQIETQKHAVLHDLTLMCCECGVLARRATPRARADRYAQ